MYEDRPRGIFERVPELNDLLMECLRAFPEVGDLEILACNTGPETTLEGALGRYHGKRTIFLFVPAYLWKKWETLKPVILHELCHAVDHTNPDRVFEERADEKSKAIQ